MRAEEQSGRGSKGQSAAGATWAVKDLPIRTHRDLLVWQKAMSMVTDVYAASSEFPASEQFGLTSQVRRCAVSIPSNIAEGFGRHSTMDYIRFLRIAAGSLCELETQLEISMNLNYLNRRCAEKLWRSAREVERMLSSLIRGLEKSAG